MADLFDAIAAPIAPRPVEEEFEAFWAAYPKRKGQPKVAAKTVWMNLAKAKALPELAILCAAAKAYGAECRKMYTKEEDQKFIAHARTWLSQRRWADWSPSSADMSAADQNRPATDWWADHPMWINFKAILDGYDRREWMIWFANIEHVSPAGTTIVVGSAFFRDTILDKFEDRLERLFGQPVVVLAANDRRDQQRIAHIKQLSAPLNGTASIGANVVHETEKRLQVR